MSIVWRGLRLKPAPVCLAYRDTDGGKHERGRTYLVQVA